MLDVRDIHFVKCFQDDLRAAGCDRLEEDHGDNATPESCGCGAWNAPDQPADDCEDANNSWNPQSQSWVVRCEGDTQLEELAEEDFSNHEADHCSEEGSVESGDIFHDNS